MCYFSPASRLEAVGIYFIWRRLIECWQKHNCPHFEKEDNMNETEAFITQICGTKFQLLAGGKVAHYDNDTASEK